MKFLLELFMLATCLISTHQQFIYTPAAVASNVPLSQVETLFFAKSLKITKQAKELRSSLKEKLLEYNTRFGTEKGKQTALKGNTELQKLSNDRWLSELKLRVRRIERSLSWDGKVRRAAFQAFMSKDEELTPLSSATPSQPIVFPYAPINVNGAYNESSGKFRAPTTGLYLLAARLKVPFRQGRAQFQIVANNTVVAAVESSSLEQEETGLIGFAVVHMEGLEEAEVRSVTPSSALIGSQTWFLAFLVNRRIEQITFELRIG